jgi:hypothetical protein
MNIPQLDISKKAMLATIHISVWAARKHDKKASREVATLRLRIETIPGSTLNQIPGLNQQ